MNAHTILVDLVKIIRKVMMVVNLYCVKCPCDISMQFHPIPENEDTQAKIRFRVVKESSNNMKTMQTAK